jgi:hypothetical protein
MVIRQQQIPKVVEIEEMIEETVAEAEIEETTVVVAEIEGVVEMIVTLVVVVTAMLVAVVEIVVVAETQEGLTVVAVVQEDQDSQVIDRKIKVVKEFQFSKKLLSLQSLLKMAVNYHVFASDLVVFTAFLVVFYFKYL